MAGMVLITPEEVAKSLGKSDAEPIRAALRAGTFPIGYAYKTNETHGKWVYIIPRDPWMFFLKTGRVPDAETMCALSTPPPQNEDAQVLRAAAAIYMRMADDLEQSVISA